MERLTERLPNGVIRRVEVNDENRGENVMSRLAAYEDTGMEPEEIKDWSSLGFGPTLAKCCHDELDRLCNQVGGLDRLREICAADKDGRCAVLPCKVETLVERYDALKLPTGDEAETYSMGYRSGHKNGQAELLEYLLGIDTGERSESEDGKLKAGDTP